MVIVSQSYEYLNNYYNKSLLKLKYLPSNTAELLELSLSIDKIVIITIF
jgi:hypothetical protein